MGREICNSRGNFLQKTRQCFTSTPSQTAYREVTVLEYVFYSKSLYAYCVCIVMYVVKGKFLGVKLVRICSLSAVCVLVFTKIFSGISFMGRKILDFYHQQTDFVRNSC